jgi:hypothetical protein
MVANRKLVKYIPSGELFRVDRLSLKGAGFTMMDAYRLSDRKMCELLMGDIEDISIFITDKEDLEVQYVTEVKHPKSDILVLPLYKTVHNGVELYFHDVQGDWVESKEEALIDLVTTLHQIYNGSYYEVDNTQRNEAFAAGNY